MAAETTNPFNLPPVVKTLFQFLPGKTLCNVASVCRLWAGQAEACLRQRPQVSWQLFQEDLRDRESLSILDQIQRFIQEEVGFRPCTVLILLTKEQWQHMARHKRGHKRRHGLSSCHTVWRNFCLSVFPSACQVFCAVSPGIVGTSSDLQSTRERECGRSGSVVCFGRHPGLKVTLASSHCSLHHRAGKTASVQSRECLASKEERTRLVLLMSDVVGCLTSTLRDWRQLLPQTLVIGGIVCDSAVYGLKDAHADSQKGQSGGGSRDPYCLLFQGRDVRVACVKLDSEVREQEDVEHKLKQLKAKTEGFSMRHSLAFMCACVARGSNHYRKEEVEASLFRKYFPRTPLLGLFGNGEIGCEFPLPSEVSPAHVELQHAYSTFLAILCLP